MGPLERRYRRLLRLLPGDHRAARGEELLGLLLDLDGHRGWPSLRQATGVVALALRLRLAGPASMLLTAFVVTVGTSTAALAYSLLAGESRFEAGGRLPMVVGLIMPVPLRLAAVVAWVLGARRTALAAAATLVVFQIVSFRPGGTTVLDLLLLVVLTAAAHWQWHPPRPPVALLATVPLAILLWVLGTATAQHLAASAGPAQAPLYHQMLLPVVTLVVALAGAAIRTLVDRFAGRRTDRLTQDHRRPEPPATAAT